MKDQTYTLAGQLYIQMLATVPRVTNKEKKDPNHGQRQRYQNLKMMESALLGAMVFEKMASKIDGHDATAVVDSQMAFFDQVKRLQTGEPEHDEEDNTPEPIIETATR